MKIKYISIFVALIFSVSVHGQSSGHVKLQNKYLTVRILLHGAEIASYVDNKTNREYIWHAGKPWEHHAPVLFPIVGKLKNKTYTYKGQTYRMKNHGFASKKDFKVIKNSPKEVVMMLKSDEQTKEIYPFDFLLTADYKLSGRKLKIKFLVKNTGKDTMYFSIGFHPGFWVPFRDDEKFEDYYLQFQKRETAARLLLDKETRLLSGKLKKNYLEHTNRLDLNRKMFNDRVIILKDLQSDYVSIKNKNNDAYLEIGIKDFPFVGLWSPPKKNADLICIESWFGHSDYIGTDQELTHKKDIIKLAPGQVFKMVSYIKVSE